MASGSSELALHGPVRERNTVGLEADWRCGSGNRLVFVPDGPYSLDNNMSNLVSQRKGCGEGRND